MAEHRSPAEDYREVAGHFTRVAAGVTDAWDASSPVAAWTARDVVRHLVEWFPSFLEGGADVTLPKGPDVETDPLGAWRTMSDGVQALLDDPTSADTKVVDRHIGEVPLPEAVAQFFTNDVFMHTWDLARATGQDATLDPERCAVLVAGMQPIDDLLRSSGQYGPKVEVAADADAQTQLLAFIGRDPAWQA
ncbi:TIGR03086 family metal-binding protein [Pseudonocardia pini]|uniref:TIGR03086 family metal-binding protein n=1 Tax=Pseudonocardia pini TaxID=2758030 RepID=UPI0015EFDDE5|nr:TIGR03086 family metal-binding protein [Pseudonocardia pini]